MSAELRHEDIELEEYWLVLKRHWKPAIAVFLSLPVLTAAAIVLQTPAYEAEGKLLVEVDRTASLTGLGGTLGEVDTLGLQNNPADTQLEILRSVTVVQETIAELGLQTEEGEPLSYATFVRNLSTDSVLGTDAIAVSYLSPDPQMAARVANKLMEVYLENNVRANQAAAAAARQFIETQLPRSEATVNEAEAALRAFKEEHGILDLQQEANATVGTLNALKGQAAQLNIQLAAMARRAEALRNQLGLSFEGALEVVDVARSPGVNDALAQVQDIQADLAVERARFRSDSPVVLGLQAELEQLQQLLDTRVAERLTHGTTAAVGGLQLSDLRTNLIGEFVRAEIERQSLSSQIAAVNATLAANRERASSLPELEQSQRELERRLQAAQSTYEALLGRLREVQAAENQTIGNARVISAALPPTSPTGRNGKLLVAGAGVAGGLLAIATAFALDLLDPSVKTARDIKKLFAYRSLATIPDLDSLQLDPRQPLFQLAGGDRSSAPASFTPASAAYHALQTNLNFAQLDNAPQIIAVTSALPQEGKTTVAANLASVMAQNRYRTLSIDGDLFRPAQHEIWQLDGGIGLRQVLQGSAQLSQVIQPVSPHLDVLAMGDRPSPPTLDYRKFRSMLAVLSRHYDRIVLDSPPLLATADAGILASMADGALVVVRPGLLDVASASAANDYLVNSNISVLGLVANGLAQAADLYTYYYPPHLTGTQLQASRANPSDRCQAVKTGQLFAKIEHFH
ncbi:polysaccharide biosynthesis tyrosine autokinase [Synechococcus sp. PCC 7336]|uniref:GumC family protein n=1 Tax=Synechococcus sp. PCC 7336 TaxID=195250 RepID=UPI0008FC08BD|nr:polysaccharide biosynthesis tyrosine autokinase [Synechococcus sp. PCC 7336]